MEQIDVVGLVMSMKHQPNQHDLSLSCFIYIYIYVCVGSFDNKGWADLRKDLILDVKGL